MFMQCMIYYRETFLSDAFLELPVARYVEHLEYTKGALEPDYAFRSRSAISANSRKEITSPQNLPPGHLSLATSLQLPPSSLH